MVHKPSMYRLSQKNMQISVRERTHLNMFMQAQFEYNSVTMKLEMSDS